MLLIGCSKIPFEEISRFGGHFITSEFDNISVNPVSDYTVHKQGLFPPMRKSRRFYFSFREIVRSELGRKNYGVRFVNSPSTSFKRGPYRQVLSLSIKSIKYRNIRNKSKKDSIKVTCSGHLVDRIESRTIWKRNEAIIHGIESSRSRALEEIVSGKCVRSLLGALPGRWETLN